MARVFTAPRIGGLRLAAVENGFLRAIRANASKEQNWKSYGTTVFVFTVLFWAVLYAIQRLQGHLFPEPGSLQGRPLAPLTEHRGQLRHQHQLAVSTGASTRCRT